ncbi:MAG: hypothetical protein II008_19145 [Oscillospiraceae bacterium]|nr:hypothetical protein [Oscillospiraceae bacterium]
MREAMKPIEKVRTRSTVHWCGYCGERVYMNENVCRCCRTPIAWGRYERKGKDENKAGDR